MILTHFKLVFMYVLLKYVFIQPKVGSHNKPFSYHILYLIDLIALYTI